MKRRSARWELCLLGAGLFFGLLVLGMLWPFSKAALYMDDPKRRRAHPTA